MNIYRYAISINYILLLLYTYYEYKIRQYRRIMICCLKKKAWSLYPVNLSDITLVWSAHGTSIFIMAILLSLVDQMAVWKVVLSNDYNMYSSAVSI